MLLNVHIAKGILRTAIENCHTTPWLMIMHHHTKFGCKRFKNSEDMEKKKVPWHVFLEDLSPHCDLNLEDRNQTVLHDTPGHDVGWCTIVPSSVAFSLVVRKISSGQRCDTDRQSDRQKHGYMAGWLTGSMSVSLHWGGTDEWTHGQPDSKNIPRLPPPRTSLQRV